MQALEHRVRVDIDNDRVYDSHHVKLSREDEVLDYSGAIIHLREGMRIYLYTVNGDAEWPFILAEGLVVRNPYGASTSFTWWCELQGDLIYVNERGHPCGNH